MSGRKHAGQLVKEAEALNLSVEDHGTKWRVTGPGGQTFIPKSVSERGRGFANLQSDLRRLAAPSAMAAAFAPVVEPTVDELTERAFRTWDIGSLLKAAETQGITWRISGGLVHVSGPPEAEPMARLIRDRAGEILTYLNPPTKEADMAQIRDIATVSRSREDLPRDAEALWEIVRIKAHEQGNKAGTNAGVPGVLWAGALNKVMDEFSDWDTEYRKQVSLYLEQTGHTKCQSRHAKPYPIWWVSESWSNGGLKVTTSPAASASGDISDDELLALLTARLRQDPAAAARIKELETANEALRSRVEDLNAQLAERDERLKKHAALFALFREGA